MLPAIDSCLSRSARESNCSRKPPVVLELILALISHRPRARAVLAMLPLAGGAQSLGQPAGLFEKDRQHRDIIGM